jgi:hypothetical protein
MIMLTGLAFATPATSSLVGTWVKDMQASSKAEGERVPQRVTVVVTVDTRSRIAYRTDVVDENGQLTTTRYDGHFDGKPHPVHGDPDGGRVAMSRIDSVSFREIVYKGVSVEVSLVCSLQPGNKDVICKGEDSTRHAVEELYHRTD